MNSIDFDRKVSGEPFWWDEGAPLPKWQDHPPDRTDFLVIGAGYTGLSAAITLADAGVKVTLVDAQIPGLGASTRNGGMFGAHPRHAFETLEKLYGPETAKGLFAEASDAFNFTTNLIKREKIACDFQQTGRIQLAWTKAHFHAQQQLVQRLSNLSHATMQIIPRDQLHQEIQTDCYHGGLLLKDHGALQPRKFHDGLLKSALDRGIEVVALCPVSEIKKQGGTFIASTSKGEIIADKVVLAGNGYLEGAFGWFKRRVFPLPSFIIATEPLSPERLTALAPGKRMMVETRAKHSYYRLSPDGSRIIFGGRVSMVPQSPEKAAARLQETLLEIWPSLKGVKITHSWSGNTGYTFSHLPQVGEKDGIHFALGYSGSGVAVAPYLGMKAAYQALGDPKGETAYSATTLKSSWLHPFGGTPHFLRAANFWYRNFVDHWQNFNATLDHRK